MTGQIILGGILILVGFFVIMGGGELLARRLIKIREKRLQKLHGKPKRKNK